MAAEKIVKPAAPAKAETPAPAVKAEPVKAAAPAVEPVKAEPVKVEPVKAEASKPAPAPVAEPAKVEPVKAEAAKPALGPTVEPVKAEPVKAEAVKPAPVADAPKVAPVKAVVAPAPAPADQPAPVVKRGRGRPRKTEEEKALTIALRKKALAARKKAKPVVVKPAVLKSTVSKPAPAPVAVKPVTQTFERKFKVTDTNFFAGLGTVPGAEQLQTAFAEANAKGKEALAKSAKVAEELVDLTKANVEAVVSSSRIAAAGVQAIGQEAVAYSKTGLEKASAAVKSFTEAKSPTELLQLQSDYARSSFDRMVAESSKMTESVVKLLGEAMEPLSNRASINAERINAFIA